MPSDVNICLFCKLQAGRDPDETTDMQMSLLEMISDSCRNSSVMQTHCCSGCLGGWCQMTLEVKMPDVEVLDWCGYVWSTVVCLVGRTGKSSEMILRQLMVEKFNSWATALVDLPAVSMPIAGSCITCNMYALVLCDETAHSTVVFCGGQPCCLGASPFRRSMVAFTVCSLSLLICAVECCAVRCDAFDRISAEREALNMSELILLLHSAVTHFYCQPHMPFPSLRLLQV